MIVRRAAALVAALVLAACAGNPPPDFAAKHRPLDERCARAQKLSRGAQPGQTAADVQAEAKQAQARGELDPACNAL
jgi:hypothetical protein